MQPLRLLVTLASTSPFRAGFWFELTLHQKAPPLAGELSVNDSEQTEGEHLTTLGCFELFPFRHGYAATLSP